MLDSVREKLTKTSIQEVSKNNIDFATGVILWLTTTDLCLIPPSKSNGYGLISFGFHRNTNDSFLECILDSADLVFGESCMLNLADESVDYYTLTLTNKDVIYSLTKKTIKDSEWTLAGAMFVDFNKNKTNSLEINVINSSLFKDNTFKVVSQFNFLLL